MNRKIRILGIAPYESLKNTMIRVVGERSDVELTVEVGNIEAGAAVAKRYEGEDFDAILSRGGTKLEIEKVTSKPVFDVPISYYDLLNVIRLVENYKGKVAIISYENIARSAKVICDILHSQYDIFIIDSWRSSAETIQRLKEEGYSLIIGDVVSVTHAEAQGLQSMLLISGTESVRQAFDNVVDICSHYARLNEENTLFRAFMRSREDRLLVMDQEGNVASSTWPSEKKTLLTTCRGMIPSLQAGETSVVYKKAAGGLVTVSGSKSRIGGATYFFFSIQKNTLPLAHLSGYKSIETYSAEDLQDMDTFGESLPPDLRRRCAALAKTGAPVLITGEPGLEIENLAAQIYLNSSEVKNLFFLLDCAALSMKELENFLGSPRSPLYALHGTVHFKGLHRLDRQLFERLLSGLQGMSRVLRCRLIMTYETGAALGDREEQCRRITAVKNQIGCMEIPVPPLRECVENITNLAVLHIHQQNRLHDSGIVGLEPECISVLEQYAWPQNLSQLRRVVSEAMLCASSPWITAREIRRLLAEEQQAEPPAPGRSLDLSQPLADIEYDIAMLVLAEENMNQVRAARRLGISRTTLWRLLKRGSARQGE